MRSLPILFAGISLLFALSGTHAEPPAVPLKDGQRIVFLGDSNTFAGGYVQYFEAFLFAKLPQKHFTVLNLGLPSETASGLSEPDHPYPRPCVHERLDRVLAKTKPNVVIACYGMNDGMYYPFSEERFAKYKAGINLLREKVRKANARLILLTPPPFDQVPVAKSVLPKDAPKFSWMQPYEDYDAFLVACGKWCLTQKEKGLTVVDIHAPIAAYLAEKRKTEPEFCLAGDGVHINEEGHAIIARTLLHALGLTKITRPTVTDELTQDAEFWNLVKKRERLLGLAWLTDVGHKRPDTPQGIPLSQALPEAAALETQIRARVHAK